MKLFSLVVIVVALIGCVRTPTQTTQIVDDRPRVSFDVSALEQKANQYQVRVDGIVLGTLDQYLRDKNALPLLPGQHRIEVLLDGKTIFTKNVFLAENSLRVIDVIHYD